MKWQSNRTFFTRVRSGWNSLFNKPETPREAQERNDLYKIALAAKYHDLRTKAIAKAVASTTLSSLPPSSSSSEDDSAESNSMKHDGNNATTTPSNITHTREELIQFYDEASNILEKDEIFDSSIRQLRREVQSLIRPQILSLLNSCKITEEKIPSTTELESESEEYVLKSEENKVKCKDILYEEQCHTLDLLENLNSDRESSGRENSSSHDTFEKQTKQIIFLNKKNHAIQSTASFYNWEHFYFDSSSGNDDGANLDGNGADEFGYIQSTDEQVNNSIRYYQMINLSRSALNRQKMGYSTIALKSTITNGGRGIYIDGFAPAGSIVAFFPGDVWPKEHLLNLNAIASYFNKDPRMHLSIRHDDIMIDARKAPYTVLDDVNSNAFAVAHIANHPSMLDQPNCSTLAIDFVENMQLKETNIEKFVPNTYKKKPMLLGPQALDYEEIQMHSMGLISNRDLQNEEIFYDYRLTLGDGVPYPAWYHVCNKEETDNLVRG